MRCRHGYLSEAIKIQNGLTFLVLAYPGCPGKETIIIIRVTNTTMLEELN